MNAAAVFIAGLALGGFAAWLAPWAFAALLVITAGVIGWDLWDHRRARKARERFRKDLG